MRAIETLDRIDVRSTDVRAAGGDRRSGLRRSGVRIRAAAPLEHPRTSAVSIEWATGRDTFPSRLCWRPRVPAARALAPTPDELRADASWRANDGRTARARIRRDADAATRATSAPDSSNSTRTAPRWSLARVRGSYYERATRTWTSPAARGPDPDLAGGAGAGPRSRVSVFIDTRAFSSRVEPRSTARRRDGGRGRVPADVRPDFGFHGYEPRSGRSDAGRGRSPVISRVAEVNLATSRGRSRGGARAVPRSR